MSTDVSEMTLASVDDVLVATNEQGHFRYPMLHLPKGAIPEDGKEWEELAHLAHEQGWDNILVFCEDSVHYPDGYGNLSFIELNAGNDYMATHTVEAEANEAWGVDAVNDSQIDVSPTISIGRTAMTITKVASLSAIGEHVSAFAIINTEGRIIDTVIVRVVISPRVLEVRYGTTDEYRSAYDNQALVIDLDPPGYTTQKLTILTDEAWRIEGQETGKLSISSTSGNAPAGGQYTFTTFSKNSSFTPKTDGSDTTNFWIRSGNQSVRVIINFTDQVSGEFVDGDVGADGTTNPVYVYICPPATGSQLSRQAGCTGNGNGKDRILLWQYVD
jgi:hypothetical protein